MVRDGAEANRIFEKPAHTNASAEALKAAGGIRKLAPTHSLPAAVDAIAVASAWHALNEKITKFYKEAPNEKGIARG